MLITLWLSTTHPATTALILLAFYRRGGGRPGSWRCARSRLGWGHFEGTLETSSQLAIRVAVVLVFALVALAAELGLDLLLGGFVAGIITRLALHGSEVRALRIQATRRWATASSSPSSSSSAASSST